MNDQIEPTQLICFDIDLSLTPHQISILENLQRINELAQLSGIMLGQPETNEKRPS